PTESDPDRTASYSVGAATSDGQRFRVLRPHARGGLGAVFVALDGELHREVALKQILNQHAVPPWVNWTLHSAYSPGHRNATPRWGHSARRYHPRWTPAMPPWCGGGEPLRSPSRAEQPRQARSAHRANGSSGNAGS